MLIQTFGDIHQTVYPDEMPRLNNVNTVIEECQSQSLQWLKKLGIEPQADVLESSTREAYNGKVIHES